MIAGVNGSQPKMHCRVTRTEDKSALRLRMSMQEDGPVCVAVDLSAEAADLPDEIVAECMRMLARIVHRHVRLKALGTKRIIVPRGVKLEG
jgi:hypothetical protein